MKQFLIIPIPSKDNNKGLSYPNGWVDWANEGQAAAVAGVSDFLEYADKKELKFFMLLTEYIFLKKQQKKFD